MTGAEAFHFLNEGGTLSDGWDNPACAKLWRYNLHYFDDLNADCAAERADWHSRLIERWIAGNPAGQGTGWEPYPTSLRIVNWVKWALAGNALSPAAMHSLAVQARWLMKRLEWHILGNHLLANAKALTFAGLYFVGSEADDWLAKGSAILLHQLPEQILADGGHFELSPMYHALAVEDVLDLINISNACPGRVDALQADCSERIPAMLRWLHAMCHPDGEIAFFNDAAFGIAPAPGEIVAYADRLGFAALASEGSLLLEQSGYARLLSADAVLIADVARIGPDYLPGHAHADSLSFELSIGTQRVIVNSGNSLYGLGDERLRQRGTAAHSTVVIEGQDSSEVWSGFRAGRRATPRIDEFSNTALKAAHDGYRHLPGSPQHNREWQLSAGSLTVTDSVSGGAAGEARFHLHPDVKAEQAGPHSGRLTLPNGKTALWEAKGGDVKVEPLSWHPEFGLAIPNQVLVLPLADGRARLEMRWA